MNLEEIKARGEAAAVHEYDGITDLIYGRDVKALVAEVERLTAENEQNAAYADIYEDICDKYGKNFRALLDKAKALQTENTTLKKALELAVNLMRDSKVPVTVESFIQQAQQTHETQEAEK